LALVSTLLRQVFSDARELQLLRTGVLYALLALVNLSAWMWAFIAFASKPALLGTALVAYILGLRHAADADHIAAIDNVVRKLMQEGKRPLNAGFFFALGHSTVVIVASLTIALTARALQDQLQTFKAAGSGVGTAVSSLFLVTIGITNIFILRNVWHSFKQIQNGERPAAFPPPAVGGAFLSRLLGPLFRVISQSWHMYPLGLLFGLGFDTATEVTLLGMSAAQAAHGLPIWSVLVYPALFTAGMALVDATDSVLMVQAYGWAFLKPVRKLWYNLTITAASVAVALLVGGVEAISLIADKLALSGPFWTSISSLNDDLAGFGFIVIGIFIASWIVSLLIYRIKGYDHLIAASN
jgi:nickel/cobalt transporter (NiCoT) family protein